MYSFTQECLRNEYIMNIIRYKIEVRYDVMSSHVDIQKCVEYAKER